MNITKRERDILRRVTFENKEIARQLNIKIPTVKTYLNSLFDKFVCETRTELLAKAIQKEILKPEEIITKLPQTEETESQL